MCVCCRQRRWGVRGLILLGIKRLTQSRVHLCRSVQLSLTDWPHDWLTDWQKSLSDNWQTVGAPAEWLPGYINHSNTDSAPTLYTFWLEFVENWPKEMRTNAWNDWVEKTKTKSKWSSCKGSDVNRHNPDIDPLISAVPSGINFHDGNVTFAWRTFSSDITLRVGADHKSYRWRSLTNPHRVTTSCTIWTEQWIVTIQRHVRTYFKPNDTFDYYYLERCSFRFSPSIIIAQISIIYTTWNLEHDSVITYQHLRLSQEHGHHVNMAHSLFIVCVLSASRSTFSLFNEAPLWLELLSGCAAEILPFNYVWPAQRRTIRNCFQSWMILLFCWSRGKSRKRVAC